MPDVELNLFYQRPWRRSDSNISPSRQGDNVSGGGERPAGSAHPAALLRWQVVSSTQPGTRSHPPFSNAPASARDLDLFHPIDSVIDSVDEAYAIITTGLRNTHSAVRTDALKLAADEPASKGAGS